MTKLPLASAKKIEKILLQKDVVWERDGEERVIPPYKGNNKGNIYMVSSIIVSFAKILDKVGSNFPCC